MLNLKAGFSLVPGQKIRIYRNLHKNNFSIQDIKLNKVIGYGEGILVSNAKMIVRKSGRELTLKTGNKNVHAFIVGEFKGIHNDPISHSKQIYYNPYITDNFVLKDTNDVITEAENCLCLNKKCYVFKFAL